MSKPKSFQINHNLHKPGLYASVDELDPSIITWDLRFKQPNKVDFLTGEELHSIEHLLAYTVRDKLGICALGIFPMGCRTGFYIMTRRIGVNEFPRLLMQCITDAILLGYLPASTEEECGNAVLHDYPNAVLRLREYLILLEEEFKE